MAGGGRIVRKCYIWRKVVSITHVERQISGDALICTTIPPRIRLCVQPGPLLNANRNGTLRVSPSWQLMLIPPSVFMFTMSKLGDRCRSQKSHLHIAVKIIFIFLSNAILQRSCQKCFDGLLNIKLGNGTSC